MWFRPYLNREFHIPQDKVHQQVDVLIEHAQLIGNELRRLFLVENILDSVKVRDVIFICKQLLG